MNELHQFNLSAQSYGTDKGSLAPDGSKLAPKDYLSLYFHYLSEKRFSVKTVLEIGVNKGASLLLWKDFFPNAKIYGLDKRVSAGELCHNIKRIRVMRGDQTSERDLSYLIWLIREEQDAGQDIGRGVDVIIDDGSHKTEDFEKSFNVLFPGLLSRGGFYAIEDLHASKGKHGDFLKKCTEKVTSASPFNHSPVKTPKKEPSFIKALHLYQRIVFIEKK